MTNCYLCGKKIFFLETHTYKKCREIKVCPTCFRKKDWIKKVDDKIKKKRQKK